jgi:hypothetical protein
MTTESAPSTPAAARAQHRGRVIASGTGSVRQPWWCSPPRQQFTGSRRCSGSSSSGSIGGCPTASPAGPPHTLMTSRRGRAARGRAPLAVYGCTAAGAAAAHLGGRHRQELQQQQQQQQLLLGRQQHLQMCSQSCSSLFRLGVTGAQVVLPLVVPSAGCFRGRGELASCQGTPGGRRGLGRVLRFC